MSCTALFCRLSLTIVTVVILYLQDPTKEGQMRTIPDRELVGRVRAALHASAQPRNVEYIVGIRAAINTVRPEDRHEFLRGYFEGDHEQHQELPPLRRMKDVVFWVRPIEAREKIVGICWDKDGKAVLFFARVYPK